MSVLGVMLLFFIASPNREVKVVFLDGNIKDGTVRSIRGCIIEETATTITLERSNGRITIGRNVIVKIEDWSNNNRRDFNY